ncbi:MAG TPA: putative metal-binding motif-containing protein [Pyrinomonadaceae bacterium]|nr:putative metal-binding motif-containing protein [Pyrinomonadaceae bacterium]
MTQLRSHLWVTLAVVALAFTVWIGNEASRTTPVRPQEADKVLEIERYPNEPLQLVNLKIGTQSVTDRIRRKYKDKATEWGTDRVAFKEKEDWLKRVSITLRNASNKPVFGVQGFLYLKPLGFPMIFSLSLTASKEIRHNPLLPGAEIELTVTPAMLNYTLDDLKYRGAQANTAEVSFSLDAVIYSDELQWYRGKLVRPDSEVPGKWVPVDDPVAMKRSKPSEKTPSFLPASFKAAAKPAAAPAKPAPPPFATCKQSAGFFGTTCSGDVSADCIKRTDIADANPGLLSHVSVSALCIMNNLSGNSCTQSTTHIRLQTDPNCVPCPDADGDGYYDSSCGGNDCNDSKASVNPGASESTFLKCIDGDDNDCDGLTNCEDPSCWNSAACQCEPVNCPEGQQPGPYPECGCVPYSPVVVDVAGNGFNLTNAATGVPFDFNGDGILERLSWTAANSDDAWLVLDRNKNGTIDDGTELFGNLTPQSIPPPGMGKNGFNALVEYDKTAKGGNADGLITERDAVFRDLLLWQDTNHNGISEANELHTLNQLGLTAIECDYKESNRVDRWGNRFRYRAKVIDARNTQIGRSAWDVFLLRDNTNPVVNNLLAVGSQRAAGSIRDWLRD